MTADRVVMATSPIAQGHAISAISLKSMPRLITTSPIPRPRMPRIEMLRRSPRRFCVVAKPGSASAKTTQKQQGDDADDLLLAKLW